MSDPLGFQSRKVESPQGDKIENVIVQRPLHRVLAFTRRTIDDVINDPIARSEVRGYFKVYKFIQRGSEVVELERQWNSI